jgi:hypothetical protein
VVSDFGLARQIGDADRTIDDQYYAVSTPVLLPVRWLSPESMEDLVFTRASDVWMFGVAIWELFTRSAKPPYHTAELQPKVIIGVCSGRLRLTLSAATGCPDELRQLLNECWKLEPNERPSMSMVHQRLTIMARDAAIAASLILSPSSSLPSPSPPAVSSPTLSPTTVTTSLPPPANIVPSSNQLMSSITSQQTQPQGTTSTLSSSSVGSGIDPTFTRTPSPPTASRGHTVVEDDPDIASVTDSMSALALLEEYTNDATQNDPARHDVINTALTFALKGRRHNTK